MDLNQVAYPHASEGDQAAAGIHSARYRFGRWWLYHRYENLPARNGLDAIADDDSPIAQLGHPHRIAEWLGDRTGARAKRNLGDAILKRCRDGDNQCESEHTLDSHQVIAERCHLNGLASPAHSFPFEIRPSPMHGVGAFAITPIPAGTRLIEYAGARITPTDADARYPDVPGETHHTYLFAIDDDIVVDASVDGNDARFINHSCDPNCDAVIEDSRIWIETIRDVAVGEELAYDYAFVLPERHTPAAKRRYPCHCGSANCRGTILAKKR